jgi:hypothetical protein
MISRRTFVAAVGGGLTAPSLTLPAQSVPGTRKKLAIVMTEWRYLSHGFHMAESFLVGYPFEGQWHRPPLDLVSVYVDQKPKNDLSERRAAEFGFKIYPTIAATLRSGGDRLAVDGVLIIGEHGRYQRNELGQTQYPRYEFFKQVIEVFQKDGRTTPVFNDKHLSWNWDWAKEMVDTAKTMKFPFLAGSSLPVTWRMPSIDMPFGAEVEEMMCVAYGGVDSYDFHALETIQCMAERRRGGETGVAAIQGLRGEAVWKAMQAGAWAKGGWDPRLWEACLSRSQMLTQPDTFGHRYPTDAEIRGWVKAPVAYRVEYADGLNATMLLMNGLVRDFTFAARIRGRPEPLSTLFHLSPQPNVLYLTALMSKAEELILTGRPAYPIERTLLTTGMLQGAMKSLASGQQRLVTPHLAIRYQPPRESTYWQR